MKLYDFGPAPNPTKVRVYLAEKGVEIPRVTVNLLKSEQNEPAYLAVNPLGAVPALELDDGTTLCESLAIMEYIEELHPDPPMIGREPVERARVLLAENRPAERQTSMNTSCNMSADSKGSFNLDCMNL